MIFYPLLTLPWGPLLRCTNKEIDGCVEEQANNGYSLIVKIRGLI